MVNTQRPPHLAGLGPCSAGVLASCLIVSRPQYIRTLPESQCVQRKTTRGMAAWRELDPAKTPPSARDWERPASPTEAFFGRVTGVPGLPAHSLRIFTAVPLAETMSMPWRMTS
jgi:hypothetical protein